MSKSESLLIRNSVSKKIAFYFPDHPKFVVGVSGGADSMALLFVLKQLNVDCLIVHVNYGLRGRDSDKDQELVEGMAFEWGFECCSVRVNSEEAENENFQNWARKERYRIFSEICGDIGADGIAVAHHKDDQIETVIQKLFRGSAPDSWSGMSEWDGKLFRPFLEFKKAEIIEYCNNKMVPFRIDESNLSSQYSRNFLRNEVAEKLDVFFPGWKENVLKLQEFGKLNQLALDQLLDLIMEGSKLSIKKLKGLDTILAKAIIKKFIEEAVPKISRGIIEQAFSLKDAQTGSELELNDSFSLIKDREYLVIKKLASDFDPVEITIEELEQGFAYSEVSFIISEEITSGLYLDFDRIEFPLYLRKWKKGDKIQPLGMSGTQKVSDHLTNRKVSATSKGNSLILTDSDSTIYAIIFEGAENHLGTISEICKATDSTNRYLSITTK